MLSCQPSPIREGQRQKNMINWQYALVFCRLMKRKRAIGSHEMGLNVHVYSCA